MIGLAGRGKQSPTGSKRLATRKGNKPMKRQRRRLDEATKGENEAWIIQCGDSPAVRTALAPLGNRVLIRHDTTHRMPPLLVIGTYDPDAVADAWETIPHPRGEWDNRLQSWNFITADLDTMLLERYPTSTRLVLHETEGTDHD